MPPTAVAITGRPAAIASSTDIGSPSESLDRTKISAAASSWSTSRRVPSSSTVWPRSRSAISCSSACRSGPSPAISSRAVPGSRAAIACTRVVKSFGGTGRRSADHRRARRPGGSLRAVERDAVVDHDRAVGAAGPGADPYLHLAVGDADRGRGERAHGAVGPEVEARGEPLVGLEGPAVDGEQADGDARGDGRQPPRMPAFELLWTTAGRSRRISVQLDEPEQVAQRSGRRGGRAAGSTARRRRGWRRRGTRRRARRPARRTPGPARGRSEATYCCAPPVSASVISRTRARHGRRRIYRPLGRCASGAAHESIRHLTVYVAEA